MMHREEDKHTAKARSRQRLWRTGPTEMGVYWLKIKLSRYRGFPGGAVVKNPPANAGDSRFNPQVRKIPLEMDMATHSSILDWEIPRTEEPGGLQSVGSQRVTHD